MRTGINIFCAFAFFLMILWAWFLLKPYYIAWARGAELVSETMWPTGALRNPVLNGKWLIYLQSVNVDNIVLREISPSGESRDYSVSTSNFMNVSASYFSRDISLNRPVIVLWGEDKNKPKNFLITVQELGEKGAGILESPYPLGWIRGVTKDYILAQPTFYEERKRINHPMILDWKAGSLKPLPIRGSTIEALLINSEKIYYSKDDYLYVINNDDLAKNKLVKFPSEVNDDNWILVTPSMNLIWRSFDKQGANFTIYDVRRDEKSTVAAGFKRWVTEYSLGKETVTFSSSRDEDGDLDVFTVNIVTGKVNQMLKAPGHQRSPHVYGKYLYWEESLSNPLSIIFKGLDFFGIAVWHKIHRKAKVSAQSYLFRKKIVMVQ